LRHRAIDHQVLGTMRFKSKSSSPSDLFDSLIILGALNVQKLIARTSASKRKEMHAIGGYSQKLRQLILKKYLRRAIFGHAVM
jgi:hypothetical protein